MRANSMCIACFINKQEKLIRSFTDEDKKSEYMHKLLELLCQFGQSESAPCIAERVNHLFQEFWGTAEDFTEAKHKYNQLLLEKEAELEKQIRSSEDSLKECIKYVCAANYIDFSAVANVNEKTFKKLMEKAGEEVICEEEFCLFLQDLQKAQNLVYLTDNCGEIVLDKILIKLLKENYPHIHITAVVRGENVINDATMEDAKEVGLTEVVECIGNGNGAPGTVMKNLSVEAKRVLENADMVISKGQGNFESLFGEGQNPYYLFLCKCELFVRRFGLEQYKSVFRKEERISIRL